MKPRSPDEPHRAATPLELFFDLVFVVAIAQAAGWLHHALAEGHVADGILRYFMVFFAIWWAWMNFTWFASAYDPDDAPYRLTVLVQMVGALILAAGVGRSLEALDFRMIAGGYVVMRLAMIAQWLRAARSDPGRRRTALRYATGIFVCQVGWVGWLFVPEHLTVPLFFVFAAAELAVPVWAERAAATPWHADHIVERYGLFTIIVLGETILAATVAVREAVQAGATAADLLAICAGGVLIVFSLWWLYFARSRQDLRRSMWRAFVWGYGHLPLFAAAAAVGAGLGVSVDFATDHASIGASAAGFAVAVPVALFLVCLWVLLVEPRNDGAFRAAAGPICAGLVLLTPLTPAPVLATGLLVAGLLALKVLGSGSRSDA